MNLLRKLAVVVVLMSPMAALADPVVQSAPCENKAELVCATGVLGLELSSGTFNVEFIVDSYDAVYGDASPLFFGDITMATVARNTIGQLLNSRYAGPVGDGVIPSDAVLVPYHIFSSGTRFVVSACTVNDPQSLAWVGRTCAGGRTEVFSGDKYWAYTRFTPVEEPPKPVIIDIKPGSDPNCFNINGHGVIPVAVLGSDTFDVTSIDQATLSFGGLDVRIRGKKGPLCGLDDTNIDGFYDLVCHFEDNADYWETGNDDATLTGELLDGTEIEGTDSICIVP